YAGATLLAGYPVLFSPWFSASSRRQSPRHPSFTSLFSAPAFVPDRPPVLGRVPLAPAAGALLPADGAFPGEAAKDPAPEDDELLARHDVHAKDRVGPAQLREGFAELGVVEESAEGDGGRQFHPGFLGQGARTRPRGRPRCLLSVGRLTRGRLCLSRCVRNRIGKARGLAPVHRGV